MIVLTQDWRSLDSKRLWDLAHDLREQAATKGATAFWAREKPRDRSVSQIRMIEESASTAKAMYDEVFEELQRRDPYKVGKFYKLRGGPIIRYSGLNQGVGDSIWREITAEDARFLRVLLVGLRSRRMAEEAAWVREVMVELGVEPSAIPERFTTKWAA